jgi:hypothetical protein
MRLKYYLIITLGLIKLNCIAFETKILHPANDTIIEFSDSVYFEIDVIDPFHPVDSVLYLANDSVIQRIYQPPYSYLWDSITPGFYAVEVEVWDSGGYMRNDFVDLYIGDEKHWRPFLGEPLHIPGRINMEHYDRGGEGIAYHDNSSANLGCNFPACRADEGVDIDDTYDSQGPGEGIGFYLSHTYAGKEWIEYTVFVDSTAEYVLKARIATNNDMRTFHIEMDSVNVTGSLQATNTKEHGENEWYNFKNMYFPGIQLTKGRQIMKLDIHDMAIGFGGVNFRYLEFIYPEEKPPFISMDYPTEEQTYLNAGDSITAIVNALDTVEGVDKVELYKNGVIYATDTSDPYEFLMPDLPAGGFKIYAKAYDNAGNSEVTLKKYINVQDSDNITAKQIPDIEIFPNPVIDGTLYLKAKTSQHVDFEMELVDVAGNVLLKRNKSSLDAYKLDLTHFVDGLYILRIKTQAKIITHKIILNIDK